MTTVSQPESASDFSESERSVGSPSKPSVDKKVRVGFGEGAFVALILLFWIVVFLAGVLINSEPYRTALADLSNMTFGAALSTLLVILLTYTVSNIAFLSIFAGILGTAARRSQFGTDDMVIGGRDTQVPYLSAILRGFMVYLVVISGTLLVIDQPFTAERVTQQQYVRLAGILSIVSFSVNLDPRQIAGLLERVRSLTRRTDGAEDAQER